MATLSDDERTFRASLEGLVDFYRVAQAGVMWRAFGPGAFLFLPLGSVLTAIASTDRLRLGSLQPLLTVLALVVTAAAPLWAIATLLHSMRHDDRYVAIFVDGLRVRLDPASPAQHIGWQELAEVECESGRLTLRTQAGELQVEARFAELSLPELARRIRDARRLGLWGRLTRPALARTFEHGRSARLSARAKS